MLSSNPRHVGAVAAKECRDRGGAAECPDDLVEHVAGQIVEDAARMHGDHAAGFEGNRGGHMRADGEHLAQHARPDPVGDAAEAGVVAEHVAELDDELPPGGVRGHGLPLRPVVAGGLSYQTCLPAATSDAV